MNTVTTKESIQSTFLDQIKKNLPPNHSFADELAELLTISRDSAYRRIRGETILSLEEVSILSRRFNVSVDAFLSPQNETVSFQMRYFDEDRFSFEKWFRSILGSLDTFTAFPEVNKELIYNAKDLPIFHFFQFQRLAAFKMYFWMKSFGHSKFNTTKYNPEEISKELLEVGRKIWSRYASIPSTEIITKEMLNITMRQVEYAHECGMFVGKNDAKGLLEDCRLLAGHVKAQAVSGVKSTFGEEGSVGGKIEIYLNDLVIGDNTVLFKLGEKRITFISPNGFNVLTTSQEFFGRLTEANMENLKSKSVLISATAEKDRNVFFNYVEDRIAEMEARVS
ncbi:MAG: helix-turn-helix transcriptional regulator [Cytophagales bacterium]|nr:helix-turn-helix transcriptional regulator [Cytophagales bacterium]